MSDDTIGALSREEALTLLLDSLSDYRASVHWIIEFARVMAIDLGGATLTVFQQMLAQHDRAAQLVRLSHDALTTQPGTDTGGADGR
ncbi:hypothetical protein ACFYT3_35095 [Nocardia amikacinitolerans]|uniref:hypothetical protein n=1 Tax=Nocardia amikacinitolerans TaxID=756689 RepID=UPI0036CB6C08